MTDDTARVVQFYVETLEREPDPTARVVQFYVETVGAPPRLFPGPEPLGCGEWVAAITLRGGGVTLAELEWASLSHNRVLDDISTAEITVPAANIDDRCCDVLRDLQAWKHELALYRDGELAWVGPVIEPLTFTQTEVRIGARDLFSWFERRVLPLDRAFTNEDLTTIFVAYATDALLADNTPNISIIPRITNIFAVRDVKASEFRRAADEMRELARTGLDWTMDGRNLLAGGVEIPLFTQVTLTTETLLDPELDVRGADTSTEAIVYGAPIGALANDPFVGRAGGVDPDLGLLQVVSSESSIRDQATADYAAQTRLDMLATPPEYLSGKLHPDLQVRYNDLVAGMRMNIRVEVGCRTALDQMRLLEVSTSVNASEEGVTEEVTVTLVPLGSTA